MFFLFSCFSQDLKFLFSRIIIPNCDVIDLILGPVTYGEKDNNGCQTAISIFLVKS